MSAQPIVSSSRPGWRRGRFKNMVRQMRNGVWGDDPREDGTDVVCVRAADFDRRHLGVKGGGVPMRHIEPGVLRSQRLLPGDIILEKSGGGERQPVGAAVLFDQDFDAVCSNFCARLRPADDIEPRYLNYSLAAAYYLGLSERSIKQTTGIQNLDAEHFFGTPWSYPRLDEQRRIAGFLDAETARIDNLVDTRARQVQLLESRRLAAISEIFEQLITIYGQVQARYLTRGVEQGWSPQCEERHAEAEEWGVIKAGCVNGGRFSEDQHKVLPGGIKPRMEYRLLPGDLLMSRASGSPELIGSVAVVPDGIRKLLLCDKIYRIRVDESRARARYVALMLRSHSNREHIKLGTSGAEGMANNLPTAVVKSCIVPAAPLSVQDTTVIRLDYQLSRINELQRLALHQVSTLAERRQALITAAVTGQFDVTTGRGADLS